MLNLNTLLPVAHLPLNFGLIQDVDEWCVPMFRDDGQFTAQLHEQFKLSHVVQDYLSQGGSKLPEGFAQDCIYILKTRFGQYIGIVSKNEMLHVGTVTYKTTHGTYLPWCGQQLNDILPNA